jgi:hypothetical protein
VALGAHAIISANDLEAWLRMASTTAAEDTAIEDVINGISLRCEQEIGRAHV